MKNRKVLLYALLLVLIATGTYAVDQYGNEVSKAVIILPSTQQHTYGDRILFSGTSIGTEKTCGYEYDYTWKSSIDGVFGRQASVYVSNLSIGEHTIELVSVDGCGNVLRASTEISIIPKALSPKILSPKPETMFKDTDEIRLNATSSGGSPPYSYKWYIDGQLVSSENEKTVSPKDYEQGNHMILLETRDGKGNVSKVETPFIISRQSEEAFDVRIDLPKDGQIFSEDERINFTASIEGGSPPYQFVWSANAKDIGTESSISTSLEGTGTDMYIVFTAVDSNGKKAASSATIQVFPLCDNNGVCYWPENSQNCPGDCQSGSHDQLCDAIKDGVCDMDCETGEDPDCVCNDNGKCDSGTEDYSNCPGDCPTGIQDGVCDRVSDGKCDEDCKNQEDQDCKTTNYLDYFILLVAVLLIIFIYYTVRKKAGG